MTKDSMRQVAEEYGFDLKLSRSLDEISGSAHVFQHESGARLLYLQNDDDNKGFSVSFKTPANDNTGVFHILEHSVLCGSEKYPVKEPFVNLLKSSMQTFLNAMTFPDKTMYPVSSTNDTDLMNLASVYMDAVFHPNIYSNKQIFEQEGWHLEYDAEDGGALTYNGVVFNEMKGALSDSESVLFDVLCQSLFPDVTYKYESGGEPDSIPTLSYESFLDSHRRHYRPSNSYVVLYGNLDFAAFAKFLNETLSAADNEVREINPLELQSPVIDMGVKRQMVTSPDSSCAAIGYVAGEAADFERMLAIKVLLSAVMGSNESPMKKALIQADIADELEGTLVTSLYQPFIYMGARSLHGKDCADKLAKKIEELAAHLSDSLDESLIEAAIDRYEFATREGDFGVPDGVHLSMQAMNGWLYDDAPESALIYLSYQSAIDSLREKLNTGYFPKLLKEIFIENDHVASAEIIPIDSDGPTQLERRLSELKDQLSAEELEQIALQAKELKDAQMAPDSPSALKTLPVLSRKDVGEPRKDPTTDISTLNEMKVLRPRIDTNSIDYVDKYFDLNRLTFDELPYASILALVLGKFETDAHSAQELDQLIRAKLGSLSFSCEVYNPSDDEMDINVVFAVKSSCLSARISYLHDLVEEVLLRTRFTDKEKLKTLLVQSKVAMEQQLVMSGDGAASLRAASHVIPSASVSEILGNIDFYKTVKGILDDFDNVADSVLEKLDGLSKRIFTDKGCILAFAGPDEDFKAYCDAGAALGRAGDDVDARLKVPKPSKSAEAFSVPADIVYCALVGDRSSIDAPGSNYSGIWAMASRAISYDFLWNEVRVMGGAYGVRFTSSMRGLTSFSSFRDPHVSETFDRYRATSDWLKTFDPTDSEFEGFVVSTAATFDKPMKASALARREARRFLSGYDEEENLRYRREVLESKPEDLRALAEALEKVCESSDICVIGNAGLIEQSDLDIPVVDLFDI